MILYGLFWERQGELVNDWDVCLKCCFLSEGFGEGCFTFFHLISLQEFQRDLQSCFFITKSSCCLKGFSQNLGMLCSGVCVTGDLLVFKYTWPCCPFLLFFFSLGAETTPDLIPANSIASFHFPVQVPHLSHNREESTVRALEAENLARQVICVPSLPWRIWTQGWLGGKSNGAAFMPANAFSIGNCVGFGTLY